MLLFNKMFTLCKPFHTLSHIIVSTTPKPDQIDNIPILGISFNDLSNMCRPGMVETGLELKYVNFQFQILATVLCTLPPENHRDAEGIYFPMETFFCLLALHH